MHVAPQASEGIHRMSYLVTVTFDLNYTNSSKYPVIRGELGQLDFNKFISGRKKVEIQLPSNTFVAEFKASDFAKASEVTDYLKAEIQHIFKRNSVAGKYFVGLGQKWA
jgi:hypothetical protein